jgi:putative tryptophan/tyrosine transport system substrate-binding protein
MKRREFIAALGGAAAWPLTAAAQQAARTPRVAVLIANEETDRESQARLSGLTQGLERLGWKDGRNIQVDYRFAEGRPDRFQSLAKELIALQPDVIVAQTPPVVAAFQRETDKIPIAFVDVSDPIGAGFIASVARPGANITGMLSFESDIVGKWLAMLREIAPNLSRVMLLGNSKTTAFDFFLRSAAAIAPSLDFNLVPQQVTSAADVESATEAFARTSDGGLMILPDNPRVYERVIALALQHRLPAVYPFPSFVRAGGLMSYGFDFVQQYLAGRFHY